MSTTRTNLVRNSRCSSRLAAAATEFAIALPLIMLVAFACTDFGRVPHFHQIVANAARTGSEMGATRQFTEFTRSSWEAEIEDSVLREMQHIPAFDASQMSYQLTTTINPDGLARIVVEVTYPFTTLIAWPGLPAEVLLYKRAEILQFR